MMKGIIGLGVGLLSLLSYPVAIAQERDEAFRDVEVRVIRQKYFQKSWRVELSANAAALMNRSFIWTLYGSGLLGFYVSESVGLYGEGAYGYTGEKSDCSLLGDKFAIEPEVPVLNSWYGGGINYTPIYGKYQLSSGNVLYFDWFFHGGAGMASLSQRTAGFCVTNRGKEELGETVLQVHVGTGQRFFMSKDFSLNWSIRFMQVQPVGGKATDVFSPDGQPFVTFNIGASFFVF